MRTLALIMAFGASFLAAPVQAQTAITLRADPVPIVEAQINNRPVRLEVELLMPDVLVLNAAAAQRLGVFVLPVGHVAVGIDGGTARLRGRLARPRLVFTTDDVRTLTGVFPVPVSTRADGVIGPGVLPYDRITIVLGPEPANARDIVIPIPNPTRWVGPGQVGDLQLRIEFSLNAEESVFGRTAASHFDSAGAIVSDGELSPRSVLLGLSSRMQPVRTELTAFGLPLAPAFARTDEPLVGATEEEAIVVTPHAPSPPRVILGRGALAHCATMIVDRAAHQMTLRCAA